MFHFNLTFWTIGKRLTVFLDFQIIVGRTWHFLNRIYVYIYQEFQKMIRDEIVRLANWWSKRKCFPLHALPQYNICFFSYHPLYWTDCFETPSWLSRWTGINYQAEICVEINLRSSYWVVSNCQEHDSYNLITYFVFVPTRLGHLILKVLFIQHILTNKLCK